MLLTFVEHDRGALLATAGEALTVARAVATAQDEGVEAVVLGAAGAAAVGELATHGVERVHVAEADVLDDDAPEAWGHALIELVERLQPSGLLASGTAVGNEVLAHVAAGLDAPLATACTEITGGPVWTLTRLRWGGILLEDARLAAPVRLATVAPHAVDPEPAAAPSAPIVERHAIDLPEWLGRTRVVQRTVAAEKVSLATAPVVVSGGRGVGSAEGFGMLEELAELTGGAVGCSRVATSNGWRPHADQVGQTGTRVAPDLYLACGISGATQHWVGCMNSGRILAINTDPEAPMVTRADDAVIGDVHEVVPAVVAEIRRRRAAPVPAARAAAHAAQR